MQSKEFYNYIVYEDGTIENKTTGRIIKYHEHHERYEVSLNTDTKRKCFIMSRLLYWLFVEQFDYSNKNLCVSYKDNDKLNISLDNLYLTERKTLIQGEGHTARIKLTDEQIAEIKEQYKGRPCVNQYDKKGTTASLQDLANKYHVTKKEIHFVVKELTRNKDKYKLK